MLDELAGQKEAFIWECKAGETWTRDGITHERQGCGVIEPIYMSLMKKYRRASCPCEQEALALEKMREQRKIAERKIAQMRRDTFAWIGDSWSDEDLAQKTFANFEKQADILQSMCDFFELVVAGRVTATLILHGPYGTGKTHLLAALCNAMHERDKSCRFASSVNLFNAIQDLIGRNVSHQSLLDKAMATPLLVLDDIDKVKYSNFREEVYFSIIDKRVRNHLPIAISTNRLADMENFVGGAVYSRLRTGQVAIEMTGSDYRETL